MRVALAVALVTLGAVAAAPAALSALPPGQTLCLVSPQAYQVFQRDRSGRGSIIVAGSAAGLGTRLEARWGDGPWTPCVCRADGTFALRLNGCPAGQATLEVRSAAYPAVVASCPSVGVGDIYVIAGQSNASGRGSTPNSYSHPVLKAALFGNDDRWKDLTDPVDSALGQVDKVSADRDAGGSVWPLLATELMAAEDVPVAFVPCARVSSRISRWQRDPAAPSSRKTLYGSMLRRVHAVGGRVRAVLFWQGETDARRSTSRQDYAAALCRLAAALKRDCGAPLVVAQIGDFDPLAWSRTSVDAIRLAQQQAWRAGWALAGPALYDIDLGGHVHFTETADEQVAARRWAAAIFAAVLHRAVPPVPRLASARYDGALTVTLRFDCGGASLRPGQVGGVVLHAGGMPLQVAAAVTSADTVTLLLGAPATAPLTVSLGSGRDAAGQLVPAEGSPWALPAHLFVDAPVAVSGD